MFRQFFTKTRATADTPFFEDSAEFKDRVDNIFHAIKDSNPELVINHETEWVSPLEFHATWTYPDANAFAMFRKLVFEADPDIKKARENYYLENNHHLLIEYQTDNMIDRALIAEIGIRQI